MLNYLISIPAWMTIFLLMGTLFSNEYLRNGWVNQNSQMTGQQAFAFLFCISAIPIFRVLILAIIVIAIFYNRQTVEDALNKMLNDKGE